MKLLEKRVFSTIEERCGEQNVISANSYYSKNGAKKAAACAKSFEKEFGSHISLPNDFADLALEHAEGALNCARR